MVRRIPREAERSDLIQVPATKEILLTRDLLRTEYNILECNKMVEQALLGKTYPGCDPCQHLWVEYSAGELEQNIFQYVGPGKALVPFNRVLWHIKQQRDGQEGLLSLAINTRFFIPEIQGNGIVTLHWYEGSKCWGMHLAFLDYDETDPVMNTLRFVIQQ